MFYFGRTRSPRWSMTWDDSFDLVVVGSGAAGLAAALRAHDLGLRPLVLEASDRWGGSTAISGGVVWIPDNPQLAARGIGDGRDDALAYLRHLTAGRVPDDRLAAYVDGSRRVLAWLNDATHVRLDALEAYADYYPEAPGGKPGGRSMEPVPFDGRRLGSWFATLRRSHPQSQVLGRFGITAREAKDLLVPGLTARLRLLWRLLQYVARWPGSRRHGRDTRLHAGNALVARLGCSLRDRHVPLWLDCPVRELVRDGDRVVGVVAERLGVPVRIQARAGVVLAAGGFERSEALRAEWQPTSSTAWNAGNHRNQGDGIRMGLEAGAAVDLMDEAWWTPVTVLPRSESAWVLVVEKSLPGGIFVNAHGKRFCNEAGPYLDVGRAMQAHDASHGWLVFDGYFRRSFPVGPVAPGWAMPDGRLSRRLREWLVRADSLEELAERCGLDPVALRGTVQRFNGMAARGVDEDFGRGESLSDRYYADPRVTPNPCLKPLEEPPFYAIRIHPGDLGTKGGLVTDADARVLRADGRPIAGLYAAGNTSASVMGATYPGAGGTIGPALVFGARGAEAAAADAAGVAEGSALAVGRA